MILDTERFGQIEVDTEHIIKFEEGLPGFEELHKFLIVDDESIEPLVWLQSLDDGTIALPIVNVFDIFEDYTLDISDEDVERMGIEHPGEVLVFAVVNIRNDVTQMTANLAAPIVLNTRSAVARQLFANIADYLVKQPIFDAVMRTLERRNGDAGAVAEGK